VERRVETTRRFVGPWWLAMALFEMELREVVMSVLRELPARLAPRTGSTRAAQLEFGPVVRDGTEGHLALRWGAQDAAAPMMIGELRIAEIDENCTELTLIGEFAPPAGAVDPLGEAARPHVAQSTLDAVADRLAHRIEAAVAEHIGTPPEETRDVGDSDA
jgi:hypothetical protein